MSSVGSIEPEGILYAWMKKVRMMSARMSAMPNASPYSRAADFCGAWASVRGASPLGLG